jgi:hypothetical protein
LKHSGQLAPFSFGLRRTEFRIIHAVAQIEIAKKRWNSRCAPAEFSAQSLPSDSIDRVLFLGGIAVQTRGRGDGALLDEVRP